MHTKRIARGARWLDKHAKPGWYNRVQPHRLNPLDNRDCAYGQAIGDFGAYCDRHYRTGWIDSFDGFSYGLLMTIWPGTWLALRWSYRNGFLQCRESKSEWKGAWIEEIQQRRNADLRKTAERTRSNLYVSDVLGPYKQEKKHGELATR